MPNPLSAFQRPLASGKDDPQAKLPPLVDPGSPESELRPQDYKQAQLPQDETEQDIVNLVRRRYKMAGDARMYHDREVLPSIAFEHGKQWVEYSAESRRLESLITDPVDRLYFVTDNQIRPLVMQNTSRATSNEPDVWIAPLSDSPLDRDAADDGAAIQQHLARKFDRRRQVRQWVYACEISTTAFVKVGWDSRADAEVPSSLDGDGNPAGVTTSPIGDVCEDILLGLDLYPDPKAVRLKDAAYVIHAKTMPLMDIVARWPGRGSLVEPDTYDGQFGSIEARLADIMEEYHRPADDAKNAAVVLEMWEKPSPRFRTGRLVYVAGNILLGYHEWPHRKKDGYPFVPLAYQERLDSLWGRNMVSDLIPHQMSINRILTNMVSRCATDKITVLVRQGSKLDPDDYTNPRDYKKLYYEGSTPELQTPPPPGSYWTETIAFLKSEMENIAGVHDVSQGVLGRNMTDLAARTVELLQGADQSKLAPFVASLETALVELTEWELALYEQYGSDIPRLIALDPQSNPGHGDSSQPALTGPPPGGPPQPSGPPASPGPQPAPGPQPSPGPQPQPGAAPAGLQSPPGPPPPPTGAAPPGLPGPQGPPPGAAPAPAGPANLLRARHFRALRDGNYRVLVTPGSGMPKLPAAEQEQIESWFKEGVFGPPGSPGAAESFLELQQSIRSDSLLNKAVERIKADLLAQQAMQMQQQQMAQQNPAPQMQLQMAMLQAKLQAEQQRDQAQLALDTLKLRLAQQQGSDKTLLEHARLQTTLAGQVAADQRRSQADLALQANDHLHDAAMYHMGTQIPQVRLNAAADPTATVEIEAAAGFQGKIPPPPSPRHVPFSGRPGGKGGAAKPAHAKPRKKPAGP